MKNLNENKELNSNEVLLKEIELSDITILEETNMPALGVACGYTCYGVFCGAMC